MPAYFDQGQGFFVRTPSWHRLEDQLLKESPPNWEIARKEANLLWEPVAVPIYTRTGDDASGHDYWQMAGYQAIERNDTGKILTVQTNDYRVIDNSALGMVIETILGINPGQQVAYEGLFTLHGGKLVLAVIRYNESVARQINGDPSETLEYLVVCSRHDGNGGLKVIRTNVRVVCANTWGMAEHEGQDEKTSFVIRHVGNWDERVAEVRDSLAAADAANERYYEISDLLAGKTINSVGRERYLEKFLPIGSDMTDRQKKNRYDEREQIRMLLAGPTCEGIDKTAYGLLQASGEWCDHYRRFRSVDTYVTRNLVSWEPMKARAFRLTKEMAGVK